MKRLPAAMEKNKKFYAGIVLNILEGLLSGANFIILYYLFTAVFEGNLQMSRLLLLAGIMLIVFIKGKRVSTLTLLPQTYPITRWDLPTKWETQ